MTMTKTDVPRIAVTDLAAYNAGTLRFRWVDVDDWVASNVDDALFDWQVEEWFVSDSEGLPQSFGEFPSLDDLSTYGEAFEANSMRDNAATILAAYVDEYGIDDLDAFDDRDRGEWSSWEEYAEEFFDEVYFEAKKAAESLPYVSIDYAEFARDLRMDGYTVVDVPGGVHVFEDNV